MTTIKRFILLLAFTATAFSAHADDCVERTVCLKDSPIYDQVRDGLAEYISYQLDETIEAANGFCGNTSGAMILKGLTLGKPRGFNYGSKVLNWFAEIIENDEGTNAQIYYAGRLFDTDFDGGTGTYTAKVAEVLERVYDAYPRQEKFYTYKNSFPEVNKYVKRMKKDIFKHLPLYFISVGRYKKDGDRESGHAMVISGYDHGDYRLLDPWAREYNISFKKDRMVKERVTRVRLEDQLGSDGGFINRYRNEYKLVLDALIGVALNGHRRI